MADAAPVAQPANPPLPGTEQGVSTPEVQVPDDKSTAEKWPFSEPQPIREDQVRNAVNFLSHPKVRGTPMVQRLSFLERKGLTREEIDEAFRRCPDPPTSETMKSVAPPEGKPVTAPLPPPAQALSPSMHQAKFSPSQPSQHYMGGPSSAIVPAHAGATWSQLIVGAGLVAAAGAGTGYLFQKVLAPKLRSWLRNLILDEKAATEAKREGERKAYKMSPLEEAVTAAAAAANAAAAAAAEVANTSREVLKSQAEEWQQLRSLIKSLDTKTEELKSTLTVLSKNSRAAEEPIGANHLKGSMQSYPWTTSPAELKQGSQTSKAMVMGNGTDRSQSNGHSLVTFNNNHGSQTEGDSWWRRKKVDMESTVSEMEPGLDMQIGSNGSSRTTESFAQSRSGPPLGRQGWVPPPAPLTMMPGAASAIRYQKPATINEVKTSIITEEKAVDLQAAVSSEQRSLPLLPPLMPGSPSELRLQNPITMEEMKGSVVAEEKEMDAHTSFELPEIPEVARVTEITSVDKEIPFSSMQEWDDEGASSSLKVPETPPTDI